MCQEKKEKEDLKYSRECQYSDITTKRLHKKCGGRLITATRNNTDNTSINRTKITTTTKMGIKINV